MSALLKPRKLSVDLRALRHAHPFDPSIDAGPLEAHLDHLADDALADYDWYRELAEAAALDVKFRNALFALVNDIEPRLHTADADRAHLYADMAREVARLVGALADAALECVTEAAENGAYDHDYD